jgi:hypothetical protein
MPRMTTEVEKRTIFQDHRSIFPHLFCYSAEVKTPVKGLEGSGTAYTPG